MKAEKLLDELLTANVHLWVEGNKLKYRAPKGILTTTLCDRLAQQKAEIIALVQVQSSIQSNSRLPKIVPAPEQRYQSFPLNDIQQAYWIGRSGTFETGNVSTHLYLEIDCTDLDLKQLETAWNKLIERHDMLRAIVLSDGRQQILESVPAYKIELSASPAQIESIRQRMSHQVMVPDQWPLFEIRATRLEDRRTRLHLGIDGLIADGRSIFLLFKEWAELYHHPETFLAPLISFRDYVLATLELQETEVAKNALDYWQKRLPTLPPAPQLPLAQKKSILHPQFVRQSAKLEPETWHRLKTRAAQSGLTPSGILLAAYAQVLATWSNQHFTLNVTLSNRLPFHPQVEQLVGVFSSINLLEVDFSSADNFETRAQHLQTQLWQDLEHLQINGIQVLRELARLRETGLRAQMPIVFTSMLLDLDQIGWLGEVVYSITQTPQVWLDCQTYEQAGALVFNWDAVEELFPPGLLQDMFQAYHHLLLRLADDESSWQETKLLPSAQLEQRLEINSTKAPFPDELLQTLFTLQVAQRSEQVAVVAANRTLTYAELERYSNQVGNKLRQLGTRPNALVAVVMEKGWEQVVAVLGVLKSGAAYLPIDPALPPERLQYLLENGEVNLVLTQSWLSHRLEFPDIQRLCLDNNELIGVDDRPLEPLQGSEDLAYVIYTSGSTGLPKGVTIAHRGVVNAIAYTNQRFGISSSDRVLALTALHHDMSVYDIFGVLAAGGTIVIPNASDTRNPACWAELIRREQVTLWNSVPAMMEMLVEYAASHQEVSLQSLRLAFLGGDWISLTLPDRLRSIVESIKIISVGGPTETTLWNICYPIEAVDPTWNSIPYGKPIANTKYYVLNEALENCPVWVSGHLYCAGIGLSKGYWQDEEKTHASFIHHPQTGERLYRAGDIGCYLSDGNIEFLGREDFQVKIGGYRIELGEIEAALVRHLAVRNAVVVAVNQLPRKNYLAAYVVLEESATATVDELESFLQEKLPPQMVPSTFIFLNALPLTSNGKIDRRTLPQPSLGITELTQTWELPRNPVEQVLMGIWGKLLGLEQVSIHDSFFRLGGNSLLAVQLINEVRHSFEIELPLHYLFESPTIAELAQTLDTIRLAEPDTISTDTFLDLKAEAILDPTIASRKSQVASRKSATLPPALFLTGATGFLGAFLLHELLKQTQAKIYCLVRAADAESGKKRLQENLAAYSLWHQDLSSRIIPVLGDLSQPLLGLSASEFSQIASQIDSIYHNGALVNFTYPYQALKATNVLGTQEILRLASQIKVKPVHFISTTTVFSASHSDFEVIPENTISEHPEGLHTGYSQSKWVAEQLIAIARSRNLPISIYRPSFIGGQSQTGASNTEDFLVRTIKGCIQLGGAPDLDIAFNITPVDYVSKAIVSLSRQPELHSQTFHIVNPHHVAISWREILDWLCSFGYSIERMTYEQWQAALNKLDRATENAFYPLLPLISGTGKISRSGFNQLKAQQFDCHNTLNGIRETSIFCPPVDAKLFSNYLSYLIETDFLNSTSQA